MPKSFARWSTHVHCYPGRIYIPVWVCAVICSTKYAIVYEIRGDFRHRRRHKRKRCVNFKAEIKPICGIIRDVCTFKSKKMADIYNSVSSSRRTQLLKRVTRCHSVSLSCDMSISGPLRARALLRLVKKKKMRKSGDRSSLLATA